MNRAIVAASGGGITRAECGPGGEWLVENPLKGQDVRCLAADPHNPDVVYAGTQGNGVLRSDDRGRTWRPAGMEGHVVKSIAVSPAQSDLVFAGTKPPAVFVSRDNGQHWAELEAFRNKRRWWWFTPAEPGAPYVQSIALSPTNRDVIVAGVELGAVIRSVDGGETWSNHLKGAGRDCHSMTFHASDGNWVYQAGGTGAAFSHDGGATWRQPDRATLFDFIQLTFGGGIRPSRGGLDRIYGFAVGADSAHPDVWYISASPGPLKAHGDGNAEAYIYRRSGESAWQKLSGGLPQPLPHMPYALLPGCQTPGHLYAVLNNGDVWHTSDFGEGWRQLPLNLGRLWTAVMLD